MRMLLALALGIVMAAVACSGGSGGSSSSSASSSSSSGAAASSSGMVGMSSSAAACYWVEDGASSGVASSGGSSGTVANWDCLGSACWPTPGTDGDFTQRLTVNNISTQAALPGATVKVCARGDVACANPLQTATTANNGLVTLTLPVTPGVGFDGLIEVTGGGAVPTLYTPHPPLIPGGVDRFLYVFNQTTFDLFTGLSGIAVDPSRGHVALVANDCATNTVAGVSFAASTADASTTRTYTRNNIPATMETETDARGGAGFINLPVGDVAVTATRAVDQRNLGTITVPVRAGTITSTLFPPVP